MACARRSTRRFRRPGAHRVGDGAAMLKISPAVPIYAATGATDLRRSIDSLAERFELDPLSSHLLLFRNPSGDRLNIGASGGALIR